MPTMRITQDSISIYCPAHIITRGSIGLNANTGNAAGEASDMETYEELFEIAGKLKEAGSLGDAK